MVYCSDIIVWQSNWPLPGPAALPRQPRRAGLRSRSAFWVPDAHFSGALVQSREFDTKEVKHFRTKEIKAKEMSVSCRNHGKAPHFSEQFVCSKSKCEKPKCAFHTLDFQVLSIRSWPHYLIQSHMGPIPSEKEALLEGGLRPTNSNTWYWDGFRSSLLKRMPIEDSGLPWN